MATSTRVETRTVCPAELDQVRPPKPSPAPGAKVTTNAAGGEYLAAVLGWADAVARLFDGAKGSCPALSKVTVGP